MFARVLLLCVALLALPPVRADEAIALAAEVARTYGADRFDEVEALRFTFVVQRGEQRVERPWTWYPAARRVLRHGPAGPIEVGLAPLDQRSQLDAQFVNDRYWLLFPLHLRWDQGLSLSLARDQPVPIGSGRADRLTVRYPPSGGYTPGDAYDLYLGADRRLRAWVYRAGGGTEGRAVSWDDHRRCGPLLLSLHHSGPAGSGFTLSFVDVAVKRRGQDDWIAPSER